MIRFFRPFTPAMSADFDISSLQPPIVWRHFATLCRIPRQSKQEAALRAQLQAWADERGLVHRVDAAGNLLIKKPATPGREGAPTLALQAHLDMVCQKNSGSGHDFSRDPIRPVLRDGWLVAEQTTLGADNGIGAALMLALLECKDLAHGAIEALFTVDEEQGMGGALGLADDLLEARLMLNLDTEDLGQFFLGCAGGQDVNVSRPAAAEPLPAGHEVYQLSLRGLRGGHSGVNIHEERGNAIKLLVRVLAALQSALPLRLARLWGGTARNAIAREAFALIALTPDQLPALNTALAHWQNLLNQELAGVESGLTLQLEPAQADQVLTRAEQALWLASLHAAPHGVKRRSQSVEGVVESSNNLGVLDIGPDGGTANFMVRSLIESGSDALADEIVSLFSLSASQAEKSGAYPGWKPNPDSPLLDLCRRVYQVQTGRESEIKVVHAGLECGLIIGKYPGMDVVSFGPTIRGAHAPGERVDVASVEQCWALLRGIVTAV